MSYFRDLFVAKDNDIRINAIIDVLLSSKADQQGTLYDVIAFQEVWSLQTYKKFCAHLKEKYPYSHYFKSGSIGSGLAIFSPHQISKIGFNGFAINGHPGKIFDGDWFANKGIGYARVELPQGFLNVFTTHLIADYSNNRDRTIEDRYAVDRLFQLHQLVRYAEGIIGEEGVGAVILGDLNLRMSSLSWQAIINNQNNFKGIFEGANAVPCSCNCPNNSYTKENEKSVTIDHILYSSGKLDLISTNVEFTEKVPNTDISYSDHYAVAATLKIQKSTANSVVQEDRESKMEAMKLVAKSIRSKTFDREHSKIFALILGSFLVLFIWIILRNSGPSYFWTNRLIIKMMVILLPIICFLLMVHLLLYAIHYPTEIARLEQFLSELKYEL